MTKLQKNDTFKIDASGHIGRTYKVTGFAPCKVGTKYAICDYSTRPGDTVLFSENDLNEYGSAFRMIRSANESDVTLFARIDADIQARKAARESRKVLLFRPTV